MGDRSQLVQAMKTMVGHAQAMAAARAAPRVEMVATLHQLVRATTAARVAEAEALVALEAEAAASTSQKCLERGFRVEARSTIAFRPLFLNFYDLKHVVILFKFDLETVKKDLLSEQDVYVLRIDIPSRYFHINVH